MSNNKLTVAITGMNAKPDNPGPGLAVSRCLTESDNFSGRVIGLSYDALDPGLYLKDYCDVGYLLPYPSSGDDAFLERLTEIHEKEHIDVFIPCLDAELPSIIRLNSVINEMGIKTFLPTAEQFRLRNKDKLVELSKLAGIDCPRIEAISNTQFFYECQDDNWTFPLVVKGLFYDAKIVYNPEEAIIAFKSIAAEWGFPVLVQEFVKGGEYNLTAVGDGEGNMIGAVMMKKMAVTDKGKAWAGVTVLDNKLYEASHQLIKALNWRGPLEVEVLKDTKGNYNLLEINPRFPAWIYLSHGVNRNLPMALIKLAMNETPPDYEDLKPGILFIRYAQEVIVPMSKFENLVVNGIND
ncbi:MAG: ATP-grasp domain-containing protein [Gammaproteobacteria bacterium]|nr:ATP-grasp domain-containing protein [Gammaproteobacteria bacterium]